MHIDQLLEEALSIALEAHRGQTDKGGVPYILHPISVMMKMETLEEKTVALLHDVIEDSNFTANDLKERGFPNEIINAVQVLSKPSEMNYSDYISSIKNNQLGKRVKLADLQDNMNLSRIKNKTEKISRGWKNMKMPFYN